MNDVAEAFAIELDSEIVNQDIDKVDLYAERTVDYDSECDIEFE